MQQLKRLPLLLQALFALFLAMPFGALMSLGLPWHLAASRPAADVFLILLTYYVTPLAACYALLRAHIAFLAAYTFHCLGMLLLIGMSYEKHGADWMNVARLTAFAVMLVTTYFIAKRDYVAPLVMPTRKAWRRSPRVSMNLTATLVRPTGALLRVIVEDVSLHGIRLACSPTDAGDLQPGQTCDISVTLHDKTFVFSARVAWWKDHAQFRAVGMDFSKGDGRELLIAHAQSKALPRHESRLSTVLAATSAQRALALLWLAAVGFNYLSPACGVEHTSQRSYARKLQAADSSGEEISATRYYFHLADAIAVKISAPFIDEQGRGSATGSITLARGDANLALVENFVLGSTSVKFDDGEAATAPDGSMNVTLYPLSLLQKGSMVAGLNNIRFDFVNQAGELRSFDVPIFLGNQAATWIGTMAPASQEAPASHHPMWSGWTRATSDDPGPGLGLEALYR